MKTSSSISRRAGNIFRRAWLAVGVGMLLALAGRAAADAGAFVEPLQFITVDTRVDNSSGTPTSGITYVLGRDESNNAILRKYDSSGAELTFTNGIVQLVVSNITPAALTVEAGTTNLYLVGGSTIFRLDATSGRKAWGVTNSTTVGSLFLSGAQIVGNELTLCGNFNSGSSATVFGSSKSLTPRGQQACAVIKLNVAGLAGSSNPTVLGALTFGNNAAGSLNRVNTVAVDENGDIYVAGHLDTGTFNSDVFNAGNFTMRTAFGAVGDLPSALAVLNAGGTPGSVANTALATIGQFTAVRVTGLVNFDASDLYTFSTIQDDGARLIIDGKSPAVFYINNDLGSKSASVALGAGLHSIEWVYYNIGGPGYGGLSVSGGTFAGTLPVPSATFANQSNKGYVIKFNSDLTQLLNTYFTTSQSAGSGGEITELTYAQGWIYATGFWQGNADNPAIGAVDRSTAGSKDVDVLKLDTGLQLKARATVKGVKDNSGFSVTADDSGNAYVCGSYGEQSASFFGNGDATNHPFAQRSTSKPSIFVAQLDSNFAFTWVTTPSGTQPDFNFPTTPKVRWNSKLQRIFWTGYFNNGTLTMGNPNVLRTLNGPEGFIAVLDPDGKFTERVNVTVLSDYGVSGAQIKPFGGPALNTNSVVTTVNTKPLIKGAQLTVSVPVALYRNLTNGDITLLASQDNSKIESDAETRISCTGYSVGENVANGIANSYTFTLTADTTVRFNWLVEFALRVKANFDQTAGSDATNASGHIVGLKSEAAGTPVPSVQKHWIQKDEPVIATIDYAVDDPDYASIGLPVRYVVTGYDAFGPPNTLTTTSNTTTYIPFLGHDVRQQVPQFLMTGPAAITYKWKLKIGVAVNTTGLKSAGYPLVHVVSLPGQVAPTNDVDGRGTGTFYFDENTRVQIASIKNQGNTQLKGWLNGDGGVFATTGTLADLALNFTAVTTNGGTVATNIYAGKDIAQLKRPSRVIWDYGDRIFEETVFIGNTVTFAPVLEDTNVYAALRRDIAPERLEIVSAPAGSAPDDMGSWDPIGKKFYPLRPGTAYSYWFTTGATNERVILKLNFKYPVVSHYRHVAGTPGVNVDPSTTDFVTFKAVKFAEATTGAAVDNATKKFTATGPGKSVLLFTESTSNGRGGRSENYRVRVVETKVWTDNLPATQTAYIGSKITSPYDTAGLGTGALLFPGARYNADVYNRDAVTGPIIPVNLFPNAGPTEQLVVVWYERRDEILWPYQPVRYTPAWPTTANGLGRIVIASRYGSESAAQDGSDQAVVPAETYGTNSYPAEYTLNPSRFSNVKIYNQPNTNLTGYNPNEEHALLAPSLRSAAVSPRPMAAYALRDGDLNSTNLNSTYTSDPYVLVQFFDTIANEARMKVYNIVRAATNLNAGENSYEYSFKQQMTAGEPVIPFYPLPQVIGATPCSSSYGKDGNPSQQLCYWKDHKGTPWAVSGNSYFFGYFFYPLQTEFWWPTSDNKQPGDCVAFLPDVPKFAASSFTNINYTLNNQTPAAQGIYYSTVWPQDAAILKVGETLTFPGGEYRLDHPTTTVTTDEGDVITQETEGLPGVLAFAAGQIVFDTMNPVMNDQDAFTKYTARIYPALEERTVSLPVSQFPDVFQPANKRTTVKSGVYYFNQLPSSLQKRIFYDPIRQKLGIKGFLNNKDISDTTLTASPPAVYCLEPSILTLAEKNILNGSDSKSPFVDIAATTFASKVNELYNLTRNPNALDKGNNGTDTDYRVGLEQKVVVNTTTGLPVTTTTGGITTINRDKTKAAPLQALGPGLALTANPDFLNPTNTVQISYVTIAENNSDALGSAPVALHIIKVDKTQRYRGAIKTILSDNVFDENIILRHTGDFGGNADDLVFEWWYRAEDGTEARVPDREPAPWKLFADPSGNAGRGYYQLTLKGNPSAPEALIADSLFYVRYRHKDEVHSGVNWEVPQVNGSRRCLLGNCIPGIPYDWAGAGNSSVLDVDGDGEPDYRPQLAEGWIKRVLSRINPYEARINDFSSDSPATYSSLLQQLGSAYVGPVALNPDKNVIENVGLIALYETIFKRGKDLSIDLSTPISTPSIANALQLASTRLSDFYRLLGNEAFSDSQDPTVGFGSSSAEYGSLAPTIFAFQNQMSSLLEQELALLRGVDAFNGAPVNNRLYWNFTHGEGEAAYALNYNISDINKDGFIDVNDAMILYPQGHGDAWGHYLTAQTFQYDLLRHRYFNWVSRSEYINSQDVVIRVDYLDERKFAQTAAAKAQAGAEIVKLTYREKFVANPEGEWQGYHDNDVNRSWGVEEWARRVGQSTYFDWVVANALLPAQHPNTNYTGIQKVDRTTVQDIAMVAANLTAMQSTMEQINGGNNPLGLTDGVLPFNLDPNFLIVGSGVQGQKFFDQTYLKALAALDNAKVTFDNANTLNNLVRQVANSEIEFRQGVFEQDLAYRNQLIQIFGTPYEGTIGSGKAYPPGYQGPDTMLYMYVPVNTVNSSTVPRPPTAYYTDRTNQVNSSGFINGLNGITGVPNSWKTTYALTFLDGTNFVNSVNYTDFSVTNTDHLAATLDNLNLPVMASGYTYVAPASWGIRTSPGELQSLVRQMVQAQADVSIAISDWNDKVQELKYSIDGVQVKYDEYKYHYGTGAGKIAVDTALDTAKLALKVVGGIAQFALDTVSDLKDDVSEFLPSDLPTAGLSFSPGDALAPARGAVKVGTDVAKAGLRSVVLTTDSVIEGTDIAKSLADAIFEIEQYRHEQGSELIQALQEIQKTARGEAAVRLDVFSKIQALGDLSDQYRAKLGEGVRLIEERTAYNKRVAAETQTKRYQDIAFRYSRNSALEKYRSSFDLAAYYTYLAGLAYDFDLNLSRNDPGSPVDILSDIVHQRTIGLVDDAPHVGAGGLAEDLFKLKSNYDVLSSRMGLNNPQYELTTFSLRSEAFRIDPATNANGDWQSLLSSAAVRKADLWQVPEFRRYCRPFAPETNGAQPGLVIELNTQIMPGKNFFGFPLGAGDHAYDPSVYSTRIHGVSVTFDGYDGATLAASPRAYLIPVGSDIMTIANSPNRDLRVWNVADQNIPVPFPATSANLVNNNWRPFVDSVSSANGSLGDVRKYSSFLATGDSLALGFNAVQDLRLIGRSVWNTKWLLIIPGASLHADPTTGLDNFINSVTDVKLTIDSYGYSGN